MPNLFAVVSPADDPATTAETNATTARYEVVIEFPRHDGDLRDATGAQVREVLGAIRNAAVT